MPQFYSLGLSMSVSEEKKSYLFLAISTVLQKMQKVTESFLCIV